LKKFLIIQTASIGDVILSTPVVEKLRHLYPGSTIDFLLKKGNEALFEGHPFLNEVILWDKSRHKYKNLLKLLSKVRRSKYDFIINLQRFGSTGLITGLSGAKHRIGFDKNPFSFLFTLKKKHIIDRESAIHETKRNLELISDLSDQEDYPVKLYPGKKHFDRVSGYKNDDYICIAPASIWFTKQFPEKKWIEFLNRIDLNLTVLLLGSRNDFELCEKIRDNCDHKKTVNLAGKLTLLETAALMKDAQMNFVNDSAPQHLASSVNAPVTTVFCSTVPEFGFGPLSDDSAIVQTDEDLDCRPCGLHGFNKCPEGHFDCARTIDICQLTRRIPG